MIHVMQLHALVLHYLHYLMPLAIGNGEIYTSLCILDQEIFTTEILAHNNNIADTVLTCMYEDVWLWLSAGKNYM